MKAFKTEVVELWPTLPNIQGFVRISTKLNSWRSLSLGCPKPKIFTINKPTVEQSGTHSWKSRPHNNLWHLEFYLTTQTKIFSCNKANHRFFSFECSRLLGKTHHQKDRVLSQNALYQVSKLIESADSAVRKEVFDVIEDYAVNRWHLKYSLSSQPE